MLILGKQNLMHKNIRIILVYVDLKVYNASIAIEFMDHFI